ncbi:MAG: hypothetical protein ACO1RA_06070 [Planctomycetaceae bacterium]
MAEPLSSYLPQVLMFGGLAVGGLLLMRARSAFAEKKDVLLDRRRHESSSSEPITQLLGSESRPRPIDDKPVEMLRWQVEMHETARDLKAEIDSKLVMLQALVSLAQEERARLEEVVARARKVSPETSSDSLLTIEQLGQASLSQVDALIESLPGLTAGEKGRPDALYEKKQSAQQLASAGLSPVTIGSRLGISTADVELLLGVSTPARNS